MIKFPVIFLVRELETTWYLSNFVNGWLQEHSQRGMSKVPTSLFVYHTPRVYFPFHKCHWRPVCVRVAPSLKSFDNCTTKTKTSPTKLPRNFLPSHTDVLGKHEFRRRRSDTIEFNLPEHPHRYMQSLIRIKSFNKPIFENFFSTIHDHSTETIFSGSQKAINPQLTLTARDEQWQTDRSAYSRR